MKKRNFLKCLKNPPELIVISFMFPSWAATKIFSLSSIVKLSEVPKELFQISAAFILGLPPVMKLDCHVPVSLVLAWLLKSGTLFS